MEEPLIYVIVLNYNGHTDTIECIESLEKINYKNYRIVIIDNNSTDNSYEILKSRCQEHIFIKTVKNLGYSGGNNVGIKIALRNKADYIMVLNNDTIVHEDFINELLKYANKKTVVVPKIYLYNRKKTLSCAGMIVNWKDGTVTECGNGEKDSSKFGINRYINTFTGCCFLMHKNIFKKVGVISEKYFLYLEDQDFAERISEKRIKMMYCAESLIWHKESSSTNKSKVKNYYLYRNKFLFFYTFKHKCSSKIWMNNFWEFISFILIGDKMIKNMASKDIKYFLLSKIS